MKSATFPADSAPDDLTVTGHRSLERSNILLFKTDIDTSQKTRTVSPRLIDHALIYNWSIDLEDIDHVLRLEASALLKEQEVIELVKEGGFCCEILTD